MSLGPLTILSGVGGRESTKVMDGDEDGQILVSQENKVLVLKLSDACILQTWFSAPKQTIITARKNQDNFENCTCIVAYDGNQVVRVNNLGSKLAAFNKKKLERDVFELVPCKGDHHVVFTDGSVGSLKHLLQDNDMEEEISYNPAVLDKKDLLLSVHSFEDGTCSNLLYVVLKEDGTLELVRLRLGVSGDREGPYIISSQSSNLGLRSEILSWDVLEGEDPYMLIWKKSGEILYSNDLNDPNWREVFKLDNCYDADLVAISSNYFAVMHSRKGDDHGSLKIISIPFQIVSSETNLKTTIHKGRGLYFVNGYLFVVGGGRILFSPVTDLHKHLDQFLGVSLNIKECITEEEGLTALHLYSRLPDLYKSGDINAIGELLLGCLDTPEDLVVDFLDFITDEKRCKLESEEKKAALREIMNRDYSESVILGELAKLKIDQCLQLLDIVCSWLDEDESDVVFNQRMLNWIEYLLGNHYVQTVLAKDERTCNVIDRVYMKVLRVERGLEKLTSLESSLLSLSTLLPQPDTDTKLPYSIQILEL